MPRLLRRIYLLLVFAGLVACSPLVSEEEEETAEARAFVTAILDGDEPQIESMSHRDLTEITISQIQPMADWIGRVVPDFVHILTMEHEFQLPEEGVVGVRTLAFEAPVEGMRISMRTDAPDSPPFATWLHAEVTFYDGGRGERSVVNRQINPMSDRPSTANAFQFEGRSFSSYLIFALAMVFPLTCLVAVFLIWKGPYFHNRWLWTIGSLFGFGQLSLNWSTGEMAIQPLYLQLLAVGYYKAAPLSPVVIMIAFPVVALIFLFWKRPKLQELDEDAVEVFNR